MGFAGSAAIQGLAPRWIAAGSAWPESLGWQREIAIWNVGTLVLIAGLRDEPAAEVPLIRGFVVLSGCFAFNHAIALVRSPGRRSHWMGTAANAVGVIAGLRALRSRRGLAAR
jgi:hypothetical protein